MKTIPPALQAHLDAGVTTLAHCWRITRSDSAVLGFTDHDGPLVIDGIVHAAASGFTASAMEARADLGVANQDVAGALNAAGLTEADLAAGRYDGAEVEIWLVNWAAPDQRVLLRRGVVGEVARGPLAFTAELRGLGHRLGQPAGRLYQFSCDAELGDARCRVDLSSPAWRGDGNVSAVENRRVFTATGLGGFADGWFAGGRLLWTSGANAGQAMEVKDHSRAGAATTLALWQPMPADIAVADGFAVTAGCDKQFATCRAKFQNGANFRGHPHMPGNDAVLAIAGAGGVNDGGRRAR